MQDTMIVISSDSGNGIAISFIGVIVILIAGMSLLWVKEIIHSRVKRQRRSGK